MWAQPGGSHGQAGLWKLEHCPAAVVTRAEGDGPGGAEMGS